MAPRFTLSIAALAGAETFIGEVWQFLRQLIAPRHRTRIRLGRGGGGITRLGFVAFIQYLIRVYKYWTCNKGSVLFPFACLRRLAALSVGFFADPGGCGYEVDRPSWGVW